VAFEDGSPLPGVQVMAVAAGGRKEAKTDAQGSFTVDGLPPSPTVQLVATSGFFGGNSLIPDHREVTLASDKDSVDAGTIKMMHGNVMDHMAGWVGISAMNRDGQLSIIKVPAGTPAAEAGIQVGQRLTAIDGHSLDGLGSAAAGYLLGGAPNTQVTAT